MLDFLLIIIGLLGVLVFTFQVTGAWLSTPRYKGPVTDHFDGRKFFTPNGQKAKSFLDVLKWSINRERGPWEYGQNIKFAKPEKYLMVGVKIYFVNHSTFLIQLNGVNILTDPVWSERVSPFSWAGPRRVHEPGIQFNDLPPIHLILLTHNHYDHLDIDVVRTLVEIHQPLIITALGIKAFLAKEKISNIIELDWWESHSLSDQVVIQSVPAQHFSGRGTLDRDASLWCGYVMRLPTGNIYFAGDSGYHPTFFKEIGARCKPIIASMIPIGAYIPRWFMSPIHCSPAEAVQIHQEVNSKLSISMHFGTFPLADDGQQEPVQALLAANIEAGIDNFLILKEGESITLS